jgi:hypothetical protein
MPLTEGISVAEILFVSAVTGVVKRPSLNFL